MQASTGADQANPKTCFPEANQNAQFLPDSNPSRFLRQRRDHEVSNRRRDSRPLSRALPRLLRFRKPWMTEDYRMSIFDAVGLAVTFLLSGDLATDSPPTRPL